MNDEISLFCCTLPTYKKSKMSTKLSGAQNFLSAGNFMQKLSASEIFQAERERSQIFERTKALVLSVCLASDALKFELLKIFSISRAMARRCGSQNFRNGKYGRRGHIGGFPTRCRHFPQNSPRKHHPFHGYKHEPAKVGYCY